MEKLIKLMFIMATLSCLVISHDLPLIKKTNFDALVKSSQDVWIVKIAHTQCGSCQEFNPIFHEIMEKNPNFRYGVIYIDDVEEMELANSFGTVMESGLPAVLMFDHTDGTYLQLVGGIVASEQSVSMMMREYTKKLVIRDGFYVKQGLRIDL
jgi:thiol-disulfide isomerase/thioredoxin